MRPKKDRGHESYLRQRTGNHQKRGPIPFWGLMASLGRLYDLGTERAGLRHRHTFAFLWPRSVQRSGSYGGLYGRLMLAWGPSRDLGPARTSHMLFFLAHYYFSLLFYPIVVCGEQKKPILMNAHSLPVYTDASNYQKWTVRIGFLFDLGVVLHSGSCPNCRT